MAKNKNEYRMTIARTTIDQLGIKLYDKASAVASEMIANAYDADAIKVTIDAPLGMYLANKIKESDGTTSIVDKGLHISVKDNGHGMTPAEVQNYYLQVGMDRRNVAGLGAKSRKKKRPVMGRKGIGKLAPFGICKIIEVISSGGEKTPNGFLTAHLILDYKEIFQETSEDYYPSIGDLDGTYQPKSGTEIILRDFSYKAIPNSATFNRQIAARFGIMRKDWNVVVNDTNSAAVKKTFSIGEFEIALLEGTKINANDHPVTLDDESELPVRGWIAYAKEPYRDEIMAGVRIFSRGKIAAQTRDFDLPAGFTGENKLRSYLVGEIHADWIDDDEKDDIIRSDRQDILWNTERGYALKSWGQALVKELAKSSEASVSNQVWEKYLEKSDLEEKVKYQILDPEMRRQIIRVAKTLISRNDREAIKDDDYVESVTRQAFAVGPHRVLVEALQEISAQKEHPIEIIVELLSRAGIAEKYSLGQVAFERVKAIEKLNNAWEEDQEEAVFQKIIHEAPWLINPQWTQLSANQALNTFRSAFKSWYEKEKGEEIVLTVIDNPKKRPDFVLLNFKGRLEIVEIKPPNHRIGDDEFERLLGYISAMKKILKEQPGIRG